MGRDGPVDREASRSLDYPLMQGTMLIMAVITILANLCADLPTLGWTHGLAEVGGT